MTKRHWSIQFHWFLMLVMPVHSIKVPMTATGEGVILVMSFNSHVLGTILIQVNCIFVCWEAWCLRAVWKNTVKVLQCNCSGCTSPSTKEVKKHTDILQLELINQLRVATFLPTKVSKVLGGREYRKHSSCSPNLKITETVLLQHLSHPSTQAWNTYTQASHKTLGFCPVSFYHYSNRSEDCGRKVYFSEGRHEPVSSCVFKL